GADGAAARPSHGGVRPSLEDRSGLAHRISAPAHARPSSYSRGHREPHGHSSEFVRRHAHRASQRRTGHIVIPRCRRITTQGTIMNDRLSFAQIALLAAYAAGMAGGQILFKLAALKAPVQGSLGERLPGLMLNWNFVAAIVLYGALSVLWVWILTFTPLSRAY